MIWLYLLLAPLLLSIAASRINPMRKLLLTVIIAIGGYAYVMFRSATRNAPGRAKKRAFLNKVQPGQNGRSYSRSNTGSSNSDYGYGSGGSPTLQESPMSRQYSTGRVSPDSRMPPMVRAPSAPLEFNNKPSDKVIKMSRTHSSQSPRSFKLGQF